MVEERICQVCILDEAEDEQHFLCQCTAYDNLRKELYDYVQLINDNFIIEFMHDSRLIIPVRQILSI